MIIPLGEMTTAQTTITREPIVATEETMMKTKVLVGHGVEL